MDDCGSIQALPGDWSVARGNESSCMDTPTEGCFCTGGKVLHHGQCILPEACRECVDDKGARYQVRHTLELTEYMKLFKGQTNFQNTNKNAIKI